MNEIVHQQCGPVPSDSHHALYAGTVRLSNAVAELQAGFEALFWLLAQAESDAPFIPRGSKVQVAFDAMYSVNMLLGKFCPLHNVYLAMLFRTAWHACCDMFGRIRQHA